MRAKGLLLINLGSPASPSRRDVAKYLREFLNDPFVIDLPAPLRWLLVNGLIAPLRSAKSSAAYQKIWTDRGSPLVDHTRGFALKVATELAPEWDVRWAMRYGQPSLRAVLDNWAVDQLYVVPLYPQYAESSTRTAIEAVRRNKPNIFALKDFYAAPEFIRAQAAQINKAVAGFKPDRLLLSYHGLPEHHMTKLHPLHCLQASTCCAQVSAENRWCYRAQAYATSKALSAHLSMSAQEIGFQSRLGRRPWIKPYTDQVIEDLARQGAKRVLVSCPSFVADCLETLEEIGIRLRQQFITVGGDDLRLVPALNDEPHWVREFCTMIKRSDLEWER